MLLDVQECQELYPLAARSGKDELKCTFRRADITDLEDLEEAIRKTGGFESVVHLAALRNLDSQANLLHAHMLNATGTIHVLEAARRAGIRRVVYASSVAVYGAPAWYRSLGLDPNRVTETSRTGRASCIFSGPAPAHTGTPSSPPRILGA